MFEKFIKKLDMAIILVTLADMISYERKKISSLPFRLHMVVVKMKRFFQSFPKSHLAIEVVIVSADGFF